MAAAAARLRRAQLLGEAPAADGGPDGGNIAIWCTVRQLARGTISVGGRGIVRRLGSGGTRGGVTGRRAICLKEGVGRLARSQEGGGTPGNELITSVTCRPQTPERRAGIGRQPRLLACPGKWDDK